MIPFLIQHGGFGLAVTYSLSADYSAKVITDSPLLYYRLNEASGTTAKNLGSAGSSYDGLFTGSYTLNGSPLVPGGKSTVFPGATAGGRVTTNYTTNHTSALTLECLVQPMASGHGAGPRLIMKGTYYANSMSDFPISIGFDPGTMEIVLSIDGGGDWTASHELRSGALTAGNIYHVAGVYRANGLCELYINGVSAASVTVAFTIPNTAYQWSIGASNPHGVALADSCFHGNMGEVAIYTTALSADQITKHTAVINTVYYDKVMQDSPAGYWRFEETSGTTAYNETGVDGTYVGIYAKTRGLTTYNKALALSGNGYMNSGTSIYNYSRNFSVDALIKPGTSGYQSIITHTNGGFYLRLNNTGTLGLLKSQIAGIGDGSTVLANGTTYHVGFSISSGATATWTIYVNGVVDATGTTALTFSGASHLAIGIDYFNFYDREQLNGTIDEVAIYSTELSADRFAAHAAAAGLYDTRPIARQWINIGWMNLLSSKDINIASEAVRREFMEI